MKILHISFEAPNRKSGGGLGIYQTAKSLLTSQNEVDYCGPACSTYLQYKRKFILKRRNGFISKILGIIYLSPSSFLLDFLSISKKINFEYYDCVVVDSTRYKLIVEKVIQCGRYPIVRVHNIEIDYIKSKSKSLRNWILSWIVYFSERYTFKNAKSLLFLTTQDRERAEELYRLKINNNCYILPVCIESENNLFSNWSTCDRVILFTGSLWFEPNVEGIRFFINDVFRYLNNKYFKLIIAGKGADIALQGYSEKFNNISIYNSPTEEEMEVIFRKADIYIAPVFHGSGMKVKVAEALSHGLPVICSQHAAIGYDEIIKVKPTYIYLAHNQEDWKFYIENLDVKINNKMLNKKDIFDIFKKYYSIDRSISTFKKAFDK